MRWVRGLHDRHGVRLPAPPPSFVTWSNTQQDQRMNDEKLLKRYMKNVPPVSTIRHLRTGPHIPTTSIGLLVE